MYICFSSSQTESGLAAQPPPRQPPRLWDFLCFLIAQVYFKGRLVDYMLQ